VSTTKAHRADHAPDQTHELAHELAALALGALAPEDAALIRAHLAQCPSCASTERELAAAVTTLADLPPEALIDGPPPHAELLVQRTLQRLHTNER
jgi:anti-sigma factor RsiW